MRHHKAEAWEARLKAVFDRVDHELEHRYAGQYLLHPARAAHGVTGNPESDGLFDLGAAFSAGFGSEQGPGYVIQVRMATLSHVPATVVERIKDEALDLLRRELPRAFPRKKLDVVRDGPVYKITGDLDLA
jgi:hypothetical protein